jgi:surfeit locus 1 family protein
MKVIRLMFSRRWWWTTLLVLAGITLTIRLGIWQISRYHQNKTAADHLAAMETASPIVLQGANISEDLAGMEYRPAEAIGIYDFTNQVAIRNQVWTQSWGAETGFILLAPLVFPDGSAVMVDRGWIPMEDNSPASWTQFDQPGQVTVKGILRLAVKPEMGWAPNPTLSRVETTLKTWNRVDLVSLQKQVSYQLLPVYLEQQPEEGVTNLPYRALPQPDLSDAAQTNVGYAGTWFAFSLLLFGGYPLYLSKQSPE